MIHPKHTQIRKSSWLLLIFILVWTCQCIEYEMYLESKFSSIFKPFTRYKLTDLPQNYDNLIDKVCRIQYISKKAGKYPIKVERTKVFSPRPSVSIYASAIELDQGFHSIEMPLFLFNGFHKDFTYSIGLPKFVQVWEIVILDQTNFDQSDQISHLLYNLDFQHRRQVFREYMQWIQSSREHFDIVVERGCILESKKEVVSQVERSESIDDPFIAKQKTSDARTLIMDRAPESNYDPLFVKFKDDMGANDEGNLKRVFFHLAVKELTDRKHNLFTTAPGSNYVLAINPESSNWKYYEFLGRLMALALINDRTLDISFAKPIYKLILNQPVDFDDLKHIEPDTFDALNQLLAHKNASELGITMAADQPNPFSHDSFVVRVPVTEENKAQYVHRVVQWVLRIRIESQINAIRRGLFDVLPERAMSLFSTDEFEILIGSVPEIDVKVWKSFTYYCEYSKKEQMVKWFWQFVESSDYEMKQRLLFLTTGSSRIPIDWIWPDTYQTDFILVRRDDGNDWPYGTGRTREFKLRLPPYKSYDELATKLQYVLMINPGF